MLFANKKEEVLDIQLTPHGRYLLSIGKLRPVYYSFHDSNILYDGDYANVTEYSKDIEDRIQHNTPQLKTITTRVGREYNLKKIYQPAISLGAYTDKAQMLATVEQAHEQKLFLATEPLGTCSPETNAAPKWSIKVLNGEISGSVTHLTASYQTLRIPQIDVDLVHKTSIFNTQVATNELAIVPDPALNSEVYADGTYVVVDPDHLLLEVIEENTEHDKSNVEVEIFEIVEEDMISARSGLAGNRSIKENLKPLFFKKKTNLVKNNILFDRDELPAEPLINLDDKMVDYYFNVLVDDEIDVADLCEAQSTFEKKRLRVGLDVNCPDTRRSTRYDIYTGPVTTITHKDKAGTEKCEEQE